MATEEELKLKKPMVWKEEDGTTYKISFSEKLQLENLEAAKKQLMWDRMNFFAKIALIVVIAAFAASVIYVFYRLDQVNFFSNVMYK